MPRNNRYDPDPGRQPGPYGRDFEERRPSREERGYGFEDQYEDQDPRDRDDTHAPRSSNYEQSRRSDFRRNDNHRSPTDISRRYDLDDEYMNDRRGVSQDYRPYDRDQRNSEHAQWSDNQAQRPRTGYSLDQGRFRGKGPKDYQRSDDRIREDVCDRLADDDEVDASGIEVSVSKGEVTLLGQVDSRRTKRLAEDCVDGVSGVLHCQNNLRVHTSQGSTTGTMPKDNADSQSRATKPQKHTP